MDRQQRRSDATVEEILADLHRSGKVADQNKDQNLENILAGLKTGSTANVRTPSARGQSAQQAARRTKVSPAGQASPPSPQVDINDNANYFEQKPMAESVASASLPEVQKIEDSTSGVPQTEPSQAAGATRRLPKFGDMEDQPAMPRVGKAAALERVQQDKYVGDAALSEWFSGNEEQHLSPREQKRLEKERKKEEKLAIKEEKRQARLAKKGHVEEMQPDAFSDDFSYGFETADDFDMGAENTADAFSQQIRVAQPEDDGKALKEAFAEIQSTPSNLPPRAQYEEEVLHEEPQSMSLLDFAGQAQVSQSPLAAAPQPVVSQPIAPQPVAPQPVAPQPVAPQSVAPKSVALQSVAPQPASPPLSGMSFGGVAAVSAAPVAPAPVAPVSSSAPTQFFEPVQSAPTQSQGSAQKTQVFSSQEMQHALEQGAASLAAASVTGTFPKPISGKTDATVSTKRFDINGAEADRVPTAAYTQEFDSDTGASEQKNLFVDEMVDDRFRQFFGETVIVEQEEAEALPKPMQRRKKRKGRTTLLTGEFSQFSMQAQLDDDEMPDDDYNNPQDAQQVEQDLFELKKSLFRRTIISAAGTFILLWLSLGYSNVVALPEMLNPVLSPLFFSLLYVGMFVAVLVVNFTTVASGLIGLFSEATPDSSVAVAAVASLLQVVVTTVLLLSGMSPEASLFAPLATLLLCGNAFGKQLRCNAILESFRLVSNGQEHSAAYVLEGNSDVAYHVTRGLEEEAPNILVSRPTALMKGFLRQSFSHRWSDTVSKKLAWVCLGVSFLCIVLGFIMTRELPLALSYFAAAACLIAPLSSSLLAAVPATMLQQAGNKLGVVVPGWSAIEELSSVNVVMAEAKDVFPASSVTLKGIKTFEQERIDLAILYAASILIENCDTMKDVFLGVIQGKKEMLFKVENLLCEVGRGYVGFVDNNRVVVGTREMLQSHDIDPPSLEMELKLCSDTYTPLYLAVSGRLFAMFLVEYTPEPGVRATLNGLIRSGVSMLVKSEDPCVTGELIEQLYQLPKGVVKVLDKNERRLMEPMCSYLPESEGSMSHLGTFTSFIGGMRAAATCVESERMSTYVQMAGVILAAALVVLLAFSGSLAILSIAVILLYQLGWSLLVGILPLARRN